MGCCFSQLMRCSRWRCSPGSSGQYHRHYRKHRDGQRIPAAAVAHQMDYTEKFGHGLLTLFTPVWGQWWSTLKRGEKGTSHAGEEEVDLQSCKTSALETVRLVYSLLRFSGFVRPLLTLGDVVNFSQALWTGDDWSKIMWSHTLLQRKYNHPLSFPCLSLVSILTYITLMLS